MNKKWIKNSFVESEITESMIQIDEYQENQ